jgi:8-oxo-dGTP pyrophosphatase MutT (NUDIX family)
MSKDSGSKGIFMERMYVKERLLDLIVERLGNLPIDYNEKFEFIKEKRKGDKKWLAAGVLIPLFFKENNDTHGEEGEFVIQLIKRSADVPQGGDLSGPGGMLNTPLDRVLMRLMLGGLIPSFKGNALTYINKRDGTSRRNIALFFANALRESWEEVKLSPFNVTFLGPLPSYSLTLFTRTIFPLVGLVRKPWTFRPNWEVEKVVEIPLRSFFAGDNYGTFSLEASDELNNKSRGTWEIPCLIHEDEEGNEEILWGATFNIILSFLKIVFDFEMPGTNQNKIIRRVLHSNYLTGNQKK